MLRFLDSIKVLSAHDMLLQHQKLRNITVQLPLDIFKIEFYDWMNAEITSYDIMRSEWIEHGKITRFPSRFRILMNDTNIIKIGDKYIDKQTTALLFRSGTVWKKENIAQLEIAHLIDTDYSYFNKYLTLKWIDREPDMILSYS